MHSRFSFANFCRGVNFRTGAAGHRGCPGGPPGAAGVPPELDGVAAGGPEGAVGVLAFLAAGVFFGVFFRFRPLCLVCSTREGSDSGVAPLFSLVASGSGGGLGE